MNYFFCSTTIIKTFGFSLGPWDNPTNFDLLAWLPDFGDCIANWVTHIGCQNDELMTNKIYHIKLTYKRLLYKAKLKKNVFLGHLL